MIRSVRDRRAREILDGRKPKRFPPDFVLRARRRLEMLEYARSLDDLLHPPSNRLEALRGDRAGQYSIRINRQWRVCFRWTGHDAEDVEIVDYH